MADDHHPDDHGRRAHYWGPAVTRLLAALDQPLPQPMTPAEEAAFEAAQDAADADIARRYGHGRRAAAA